MQDNPAQGSAPWSMRDFSGMAVAALTPFEDGGDLAPRLIPAYVDFLISGGADALMVGGTTGEFIAMDERERRLVLDAFVDAVDGRVPVIAHVGHAHPAVAHRLAASAADHGVAAIAAILPYFHPTSTGAVRDALVEIAAAQPAVPFLAYLHPATGNQLPAEELAVLMDALPNVVGAKLSLASWQDFEAFLPMLGRGVFFCGNDALLPAFVGKGGRASVTGNAAVYPEAVGAAMDALLGGDADAWSSCASLLDEVVGLTVGGSPDRLKGLLRERGGDAGSARVRTGAPETGRGSASTALRATFR